MKISALKSDTRRVWHEISQRSTEGISIPSLSVVLRMRQERIRLCIEILLNSKRIYSAVDSRLVFSTRYFPREPIS